MHILYRSALGDSFSDEDTKQVVSSLCTKKSGFPVLNAQCPQELMENKSVVFVTRKQ